MSRKSFYDLRFGVAPGGARKDAHYLRGTLDEVKADLAAELADGGNLYLLCWYGADLALDVYQHGRRTRSIDLHPFVSIDVEGYPRITFTGPGKPVGHDFSSEQEQSVDDGSLSDLLFMGAVEQVTTVTVDWAAVDVPALRGEPARPGDLVIMDERMVGDAEADEAREQAMPEAEMRYGYTDFEA
ncbi:hypothetical protein [Catellatospora coxensis]|uniref:Uncharacterized protein n=1 Tax=Catellatospora coxensis TaxID=310354 RepID=A0A8J3P4U4_9ACTN|nr:hypothetical protein [Catellatospora coxensis]GIG03707.1 hypothetical protein Cco03nite_04070 [Catellatospora coxensis]